MAVSTPLWWYGFYYGPIGPVLLALGRAARGRTHSPVGVMDMCALLN